MTNNQIETLVDAINKASQSVSGNEIKREAILETLEIITDALQQLEGE